MLKRIFNIFITISILISIISLLPVFAQSNIETIEIVITDLEGNEITTAHIGEVFRVNVYLSNFDDLLWVSPSLHFNAEIAQVSNRDGDILPTGFGNQAPNFFRTGNAIGNPYGLWRGVHVPVGPHPFLNNRTGLLGMTFTTFNNQPRNLTDRQLVYSVYMVAIAAGNPDIRLTCRSDGYGKNNPQEWYDWAIFARGSFWFVHHGPINSDTFLRNNRYNGIMPTFNTLENITIDLYYDGIPADGILQLDKYLTILTTIRNIQDYDMDVMVIVAAYDEKGRLLESTVRRRVIYTQTRDEINFEYKPSALGVEYIKIFIWNANTMAPYVPSIFLRKAVVYN
ncbi:MAG: hypothetical protein FWE04_02070 [Oscillospiraceae bacterium]|nr:hypothetical protein [Oscillospiraceae bacterium]